MKLFGCHLGAHLPELDFKKCDYLVFSLFFKYLIGM